MAPIERAMVVSYRLSIVTVALSVTIRPQFAIECLRRSNQINRGWVILNPILGVFPLEQTRHVGVAKSERPGLTNGEMVLPHIREIYYTQNLQMFTSFLRFIRAPIDDAVGPISSLIRHTTWF